MPSSVVRSFAYQPSQLRLDILFTTGRRYSYQGVPPETAEAMRMAFAKGEFFNRHIRDRYPFTRAEEISEPAVAPGFSPGAQGDQPMPKSTQTAGRDRNGAQPLGAKDGTSTPAKIKRTGQKESRSAGPDGPDASVVGETFKSKP